MGQLPPSAQRVQDLLASLGFGNRVVEMPESTRTAAEAAAACGCTVAQIAKSIVLRARESDRPVVVIASGPNRVDEAAIAAVLGEPVGKADADFVRVRTGYAIGGVAPVGHPPGTVILIDDDLMAHAEIWAAAGTPRCVFRLTPEQLRQMTGGTVARVKLLGGSA